MPRMSQLTKSESPYLKHGDMEEILGCKAAEIDVTVTVELTTLDKYPDGKPAYCMKFAGIPKPLGLNKTNLRKLEELCPYIEEFPSSKWAGLQFRLFCVETEMGPGLRIGPARDTVQEETQHARERIERAMQAKGEQPKRVPQTPQEPPGFVDQDDPGFSATDTEIPF